MSSEAGKKLEPTALPNPYRDPAEIVRAVTTLPSGTIEEALAMLRVLHLSVNAGGFEELERAEIAAMIFLIEGARDELAASITRDQDRYAWILGMSVPASIAIASKIGWPGGLAGVVLVGYALVWAFSGLRSVRQRQLVVDSLNRASAGLVDVAKKKPAEPTFVRAVMDKREELTKTVDEEMTAEAQRLNRGDS